MINFKSLVLSVAIASIFVINLLNGAQFLNDTCVAGALATVISPLTKM